MARWHERFRFPWHSDHLAYNRIEHGGVDLNLGFTMPLPLDLEALDLLVERAAAVGLSYHRLVRGLESPGRAAPASGPGFSSGSLAVCLFHPAINGCFAHIRLFWRHNAPIR